MNESILKALMRLFAIIAKVEEDGTVTSRTIVELYLKQHLNKELGKEYLELFDEFVAKHHKKKGKKRVSSNSVKVLMICEQINEELEQNQKMLVLIQLLEFISYDENTSEIELEFVKTVSDTFNINEEEYRNCQAFILDPPEKIIERGNVLVVNNNTAFEESEEKKLKHLQNDQMEGDVIVMHIESTDMYVIDYVGSDSLYLNGQVLIPRRPYILIKGASVRNQKMSPIYYSDIVSKFLASTIKTKIVFTAEEVIFRFKNSENGIQKFTLSEESGQLIGVMGGSGAGKSTLLNLLNGNLKPLSGKILINGYDIHEHKEKLEGVIGFVPQDDLLIEELTVYQNLYYNSKLCFDDFNEEQIDEAVTKVLHDLDLFEIKDLKVGGPLNKFISGGQRKRLNIALELIREPSVMFVDEPTSGLSSMDSEMVMDLLKEQTLKGRLVITNIHQPSSDIYKLLDKLLIMDKGGHPVYYGNPIDAVVYFKKMANYVNADESECITCGNVNPEQVLQILESKVVDEYGKLTRSRKVSSKEWYNRFKKNIQPKLTVKESATEIPENHFKIPSKLKQFAIFTIRDVLSKFTNKQYLLLNFLEAPVLAVILGYFTKYIAGETYIFSENENLPAYMFMAVVVSLFLGMTVSAEEIIKDRKILQRESFLNLSRFSYINSKVMIMLAISAVQTISFVLVGNFVIGIQGMTFEYWLVLFSASSFANILGLNISASLNSVVTIYILIPFILVPQLLLSGVIVKFDKLHKNITSHEYVPVVGDMMTSRWAYEALAVSQFKNNKYQKHFFVTEQRMSDAGFKNNFLITQLLTKVTECTNNYIKEDRQEDVKHSLTILKNEIEILQGIEGVKQFKYLDSLNLSSFTPKIGKKTEAYLRDTKSIFSKKYRQASSENDKKINELMNTLGDKDAYFKLRDENFNYSLSDAVKNKQELRKIYETDDRLIQTMDPIYKYPESNYGRAHFYSPVKRIGNYVIDTFWFNVIFIWLTSLTMYISLCFDGLRKLLDFDFSSIKFPWKK